jgi:hypothetical protein
MACGLLWMAFGPSTKLGKPSVYLARAEGQQVPSLYGGQPGHLSIQ